MGSLLKREVESNDEQLGSCAEFHNSKSTISNDRGQKVKVDHFTSFNKIDMHKMAPCVNSGHSAHEFSQERAPEEDFQSRSLNIKPD